MTDSPAGVEDEIERALRLGLATAAQLADRAARARRDLARHTQHRSEQEGRHFEARLRAEGASAAARLAVVDRPEWWDRATATEIVGIYELASSWQADQPSAATAVDTIAGQVRDRYGIDMRVPGAGSDEVRAALARIELGRTPPPGRRAEDTAAAVMEVARANQRDTALAEAGIESPELQGEPIPFDSTERRQQTVSSLREAGLPEEVVAVAMRADIAHGRPAAEAASNDRRTTVQRHTHGRGAQRGAQRSDQGR